jgi:hypothetical protein
MRELAFIKSALAGNLPPELVSDLLDTFLAAGIKFNAGDFEGVLNKAGLFSEHALRALLFHVAGSLPAEIERFGDAVKSLAKFEGDEAISILMPRILAATAYDLRSKRGAAHVKGVNPKKRDAALAVTSMSWVLAEMLSIFGTISGNQLDSIIASLMRRKTPLLEHVGGQPVVTAKLPAHVETLLIIDGHPEGINRRDIGRLVKASPSSVTHALTKIGKERLAHCVDGLWFITGRGEEALIPYF